MKNKISVVQLTLSLDDWKPRIWRRIWIIDDTPLNIVSMYLYSSMSWCGYHLSEIKTNNASYGDTSIDDPLPEMLDWEKYTLRDLVDQEIKQFKYFYDFGDSWEMTVNMSVQKRLDLAAPYPVCVNGENAAPPEDVGSYPGYDHFIKVMKNPKHQDYKLLSKWWGRKTFDPSHFSVDETNDDIDDAIETREEHESPQILTKAGSVENKFRYYTLFTTIKDKKINAHDKEIIEMTIKLIDEKLQSKMEKILYGDGTYVHVTWLIPDSVATQSVYDLFLDSTSSGFNILNYHVNSSNVDDFTQKDIIKYKKFLKEDKHETDD